MDILLIFTKAVVITFFIYGVLSFISNVREDYRRDKANRKQSKDTVIPPSYAPRSHEDMKLS